MKIYLDHAATTPIDKTVFSAMKPYFLSKFGNPSEMHFLGYEAKKALETSRVKVAAFLNAGPAEVIFTGCASESINLAHKGLVRALPAKPRPHIITSKIEHKAVLETCRYLKESKLADVTYLDVDKDGLVSVEDVEKAIRLETVLVSIMYVNNEVGTIQPIAEIGKLLQKHSQKIYFHSDATQAIQYLNCDVKKLGVDLLSFSGHKCYAPKGIGALYVKGGTPLSRIQDGGSQEFKKRAGTENVAFAVGLAKALEIKSKNLQKLQQKIIKGVLQIPQTKLTGHPTKRAPHIASFVVEGAEGEALVLALSNLGIAASSGSACTSDRLSPSHVLTAMGIPAEISHGSLRFSLGKDTTEAEINYVIKVLPGVVEKLRIMAPKF